MRARQSEENPFEEDLVAREWIHAVEGEVGGSRDREIYPLLRAWSATIPSGLILEIGSGQGICSSQLDLSARSYLGVEPSVPLVNRAKELYDGPNKRFIVGSAYDLPIDAESIDAAFSVGVWFHIGDLDRAHREAARVLKPGGGLLIVTSNPSLHGLWEKWFDNPRKEGNVLDGKLRVPHYTLSRNLFYMHTEDDISLSLRASGFSVASIEKFGFGKEGSEVHRDEGAWMAVQAVRA